MSDEIELLLFYARMLGITPQNIIKRKFITTKWWMFYCGLVNILFMHIICQSLYFVFSYYIAKEQYLIVSRRILVSISVIMEVIISIVSNDRFSLVLDFLHDYDVHAKFEDNSQLSRISCQFLLMTIFGYWIVVGYITWICSVSHNLRNGIMYGFGYTVTTMSVLKFCGMMRMILRRFNHLMQLIAPKELMKPRISVMKQEKTYLELKDVWRLHSSLSSAVEEINRIYSYPLIFWIATFSWGLISRMFNLTSVHRKKSMFELREALLVLAYVTILFLITVSCHLVKHRANKCAESVFSAGSIILRGPSQTEQYDGEFIYFRVKELHLTAANGMMEVHLPLLLNIIGFITTYLIILGQK